MKKCTYTIKVEHDVPLPLRKGTRYPWHNLKKAGDSFFVPLNGRGSLANLQVSLLVTGRRHYKVSTRRDPVRHGVRVWRLE